jgi:hypothetical protein
MDNTITPQDGINPESEVVEVPVVEETTETPAPIEAKTYSQEEWNQLHQRAKRAEAELKTLKPLAKAPAQVPTSPQSVEETVLLANGMPDELLVSLKKVAAVEGISSFIKAQTSPLFVAIKEKFEREQKQKASSMPASRGAGSVKAQKDFKTPGLTAAEHKAMVKKMMAE